jgi:hypothetical protein
MNTVRLPGPFPEKVNFFENKHKKNSNTHEKNCACPRHQWYTGIADTCLSKVFVEKLDVIEEMCGKSLSEEGLFEARNPLDTLP